LSYLKKSYYIILIIDVVSEFSRRQDDT